MIQGNKACSIGPAQCEHSEPIEKPADAMVMNPGKKLDAPGTIPVINGCVHYEHLLCNRSERSPWPGVNLTL